MPMTIPYDPSLVMGNIVHPDALENLLAMGAANMPIDAAQERMNSLIAMKRSVDMTIQELENMKVDNSELIKESIEINKQISEAAKEYVVIKLQGEKILQGLRGKRSLVSAMIESPLDYNKSDFKPLPLSSDSLKMDCQYFSYDENRQSSVSTVSSIRNFIEASGNSALFGKSSTQASSAVTNQVNLQREYHDIAGTLIISVTCTHKQSQLIAPFILDVDKAIRIWNSLFLDAKDKLNPRDPYSMITAAQEGGTTNERKFDIISGATLGSCFIGMVHILNSSSTRSMESMTSIAQKIQAKAQKGWFFSNVSGSAGLDASFAASIKDMLSSQTITSHVNLVTMGVIPSIKANAVQNTVKEITNFNPNDIMGSLIGAAEANESNHKTFASEAAKAKGASEVLAVEAAKVTNVMSSLNVIEREANKILDINTMMEGLEDYISKISEGDVGIPINYYLKPISRAQLSEMWVAKYFPGEFLTLSGDDSEPVERKTEE